MRKRVEKVLGIIHLSLTKNVMIQMALSIENYKSLNLRNLAVLVYGLEYFPVCPNAYAEAKIMFNATVDEVLKVLPNYKGGDIEIFVATSLLLKIYFLYPDIADGSNFDKVLEAAETIQSK